MRRIAGLLIVLAIAAPVAGAAARATAPAPVVAPPVTATTFLVTGRGYGHGVGMSQYGALGFARNGAPYTEILAHYYPGTTIGIAPPTVMRVLLAEQRQAVEVASSAPFELEDAAGTKMVVPAGTLRIAASLKLKVKTDGSEQQLEGPVIARSPQSAPLRLDGRAYRGVLELRSDGKRLAVVNRLGLELYLLGVVPGEMPNDWPPEALKAQAVAARSYALAARLAGRSFDVYADVRSQVYGGIAYEKPTTTAAISDTAGEIVLYGGKVATTYFYSTSGGKTAAAEEVFAKPVPYLVPVEDPYDSLSPYHRWGPVAVTAAKVASALKAPGVRDLSVVAGSSGRARSVVLRTARGDVTVKGTEVRVGLGLRSTWFRVGLLSVQRPVAPVVYGGATRLTGTARGVTGVTLSTRVNGLWQPVRTVEPGPFTQLVKPRATTFYRLANAAGQGATLRVPVAPRVEFDGGAGSVVPTLPGATVVLEALEGDTWRELGREQVFGDGSYLFGVRLGTGVYRVRVPATRGFAEGVSPELRLR
jgi:stage II sporulation protein D